MVLHHLQIYDAEPILTYRHITDIIAIKTGSAFTLFHSLIHGIDEHRSTETLRVAPYQEHLFLTILLLSCRFYMSFNFPMKSFIYTKLFLFLPH